MMLLWLLFLLQFSATYAQQYYDPSDCSSGSSRPGSRYTCNSSETSCQTYFVYRTNKQFKTIASISALLQVDSNKLLHVNKLNSSSSTLELEREVLVPITCSCAGGQFFQANFNYSVPQNTTLSEVACAVFDGLVKSQTLAEENGLQEADTKVGSKLQVPLRCACPENFSSNGGVNYLVAYPLVLGDSISFLSEKFGISPEDLGEANHFEPWQTIFPNTTVLIPLKTNSPFINFSLSHSPPPTPDFLPTVTVENRANTKLRNLYILGSVVGICLVLALLVACGLYIKVLRKGKIENFPSFNTRSSPLSCSTARSSPRSGQTYRSSPRSGQTNRSPANTTCLSPDLLVGIKYSLKNLTIEDLKRATKDFSEEAKIGDRAYKGIIDNVGMMIKQMRFEDTREVIDIHSKINHINIVNLLGVCYGENDFSWSYLAFELPSNGSLRSCLSNSSSPLRWHRRTQIAFDIATGLHYLHYCIFPSYAHMKVSSENIFLTSKWRAKLTNIRTNPAGGSSKRNDIVENVHGWVAPEYTSNGLASEKVDIFAFGFVLLELISGREDLDGRSFKDSIGFLGGGAGEGGCFEQLRCFMDPCLKEDYPLAEALCLAVLAKACVEDDPLHRPSMDDILKVLVRMV